MRRGKGKAVKWWKPCGWWMNEVLITFSAIEILSLSTDSVAFYGDNKNIRVMSG